MVVETVQTARMFFERLADRHGTAQHAKRAPCVWPQLVSVALPEKSPGNATSRKVCLCYVLAKEREHKKKGNTGRDSPRTKTPNPVNSTGIFQASGGGGIIALSQRQPLPPYTEGLNESGLPP
jgi:hypothetical protein